MTEKRKVSFLDEPEQCRWFSTCDRMTEMTVVHPILGDTPVCARCATTVGMELDIPGVIHHLAFHLSEEVPICDAEMQRGDELSLSSQRINCTACRSILGFGDLKPEENE